MRKRASPIRTQRRVCQYSCRASANFNALSVFERLSRQNADLEAFGTTLPPLGLPYAVLDPPKKLFYVPPSSSQSPRFGRFTIILSAMSEKPLRQPNGRGKVHLNERRPADRRRPAAKCCACNISFGKFYGAVCLRFARRGAARLFPALTKFPRRDSAAVR
jgi:hypothetical protein